MKPPAREDPIAAPIGVAAILLATALAIAELAVPNDLFWHLAIARRLLASGFPRVEPFAFTARAANGGAIDWSPPEWLGELAFGGAFSASGFLGTAALTVGVVLLLYVSVYGACRATGAPVFIAALSVAVVSVPASVHLPMRPLVFGHLFTAWVIERLVALRAGDHRGLFLFPLGFALWSNVHPSWPIGLVLLELHVLALVAIPALLQRGGFVVERLTPEGRAGLVFAGTLSPFAVILRPDGLDGALYPFIHVVALGERATQLIEWSQPDLALPVNLAFFGLVVAALALAARRPTQVRALDVGLVLLGAYLALRHQRFLPLASMLAAPVLARGLSRTGLAAIQPRRPIALGMAASSLFLCAVSMPTDFSASVREAYPVDAVRYLRRHDVGSHLFNTFEDGGYLLFARPGHQVFIDSRFDLYARCAAFDDYLALRRGERVRQIFETYDVDAALVPTAARDESFAALERQLPELGFRVVYEDPLARVWVSGSTAETRAIPSRSP